MKKSECEPAIRYLCSKWADVAGIPMRPDFQPSYVQFKAWACANGYDGYFKFRSVMGPDEDAERWFDEEFHQTWRN